jgi:hypothetical protein
MSLHLRPQVIADSGEETGFEIVGNVARSLSFVKGSRRLRKQRKERISRESRGSLGSCGNRETPAMKGGRGEGCEKPGKQRPCTRVAMIGCTTRARDPSAIDPKESNDNDAGDDADNDADNDAGHIQSEKVKSACPRPAPFHEVHLGQGTRCHCAHSRTRTGALRLSLAEEQLPALHFPGSLLP